MDIEKIIEDSNPEETEDTATFLTYFMSMAPLEEDTDSNVLSFLDMKSINDKIPVGPESYLDSACVEVAEALKQKNIYSLASLRTNKYMYLFLDKLSLENMNILKDKHRENSRNYFMHYENTDYFGIRVFQNNRKDRKISNELLNLVTDFKMQDIQRGYYNEKNFLMNICDCEKVEGLTEVRADNAQVVFDVNKMDKSFRDYLKESGYENYYLQDEHRVYLNDFYYNAHQNYLNEIKT